MFALIQLSTARLCLLMERDFYEKKDIVDNRSRSGYSGIAIFWSLWQRHVIAAW
jgi:hypothetical protein